MVVLCFKQKTAYEMRISDWSSDVCSSDLRTAEAVFAEKGRRVDYLVGTMIELPRAALMAGEIAEVGAFFSFGTNDLTQTALGVSRDDASRFLTSYVEQGIYPKDPFVSLDVEGVGELISIAKERGRKKHGRAHVCTTVTNA